MFSRVLFDVLDFFKFHILFEFQYNAMAYFFVQQIHLAWIFKKKRKKKKVNQSFFS